MMLRLALIHQQLEHNVEMFTEIAMRQDRRPSLEAALKEAIAHGTLSEPGMSLLVALLATSCTPEQPSLDLKIWSLPRSGILQVISSFPFVESIDLSFNIYADKETVTDVIKAASHLKRLVLMGCTALSSESLAEILAEQRSALCSVDTIIHASLLQPVKGKVFPDALSVVLGGDAKEHPQYRIAVPYMSCSRALRLLTRLLRFLSALATKDIVRKGKRNLARALLTGHIGDGKDERWAARDVDAGAHSFPHTGTEGWTFVFDAVGDKNPSRWGENIREGVTRRFQSDMGIDPSETSNLFKDVSESPAPSRWVILRFQRGPEDHVEQTWRFDGEAHTIRSFVTEYSDGNVHKFEKEIAEAESAAAEAEKYDEPWVQLKPGDNIKRYVKVDIDSDAVTDYMVLEARLYSLNVSVAHYRYSDIGLKDCAIP
jgi:hypothetical protein